MLRRVALVRTDVSEELSASFIRVTRIDELGTTPAVTSNRRTLRRNAKILTTATRCNIPEDIILHSHRRENLKFYNQLILQTTLLPTHRNTDVDTKSMHSCPLLRIESGEQPIFPTLSDGEEK
jgi:hypothetical protein